MERQGKEGAEMKEKKHGKQGGIRSNTFVKIVAFFVLAGAFAVGAAGTLMTAFMWDGDAYTGGINEMARQRMIGQIWNDQRVLGDYFVKENTEELMQYLRDTNLSVELYRGDWETDGTLLWSNYSGAETPFSFTCYTELNLPVEVSGDMEKIPETDSDDDTTYLPATEATDSEQSVKTADVEGGSGIRLDVEPQKEEKDPKEQEDQKKQQFEKTEVTFRLYVNSDFPKDDEYKDIYVQTQIWGEYLYAFPIAALTGGLLFLCSFIFLMCCAGHHRGREGITGGILSNFHFDVLTFVFGAVALFGIYLMVDIEGVMSLFNVLGFVILAIMEVVWCTIYCMEFAVQLKMGTVLKNTLVFQVIKGCFRLVKAAFNGIRALLRGLPLLAGTLIGYLGLCFVEFLIILFLITNIWYLSGDILIWFFLEKLFVLPILLYFALVYKKLQAGSKELAEGNLGYKINTSKMILAFKEHGENLNRIRDGISLAVEERMRSERLKTELITNVSHDLKTPLTSIINYADLIGTAVRGTMPGSVSFGENGAKAVESSMQNEGVESGIGSTDMEVGKAGPDDGTEADMEDSGGNEAGAVDGIAVAGENEMEENRSADGMADAETGTVKAEPDKTRESETAQLPQSREQAETYASGDGINRQQITEYADVLLRQSKRLKKLLEDLVEASKATTGSLEVNMMPCEISVILSQAVGEYEQRFTEKQLELMVRQPEESIVIQADGRHLWRVFDNLLNNICKYAQENSRVYLTVEKTQDEVEIIFRNMSKYPLEMSAEELQERFVRGDKSRHMEGNGLGLSIAGSLVELQKGSMKIVTDGDLFKVILRFKISLDK